MASPDNHRGTRYVCNTTRGSPILQKTRPRTSNEGKIFPIRRYQMVIGDTTSPTDTSQSIPPSWKFFRDVTDVTGHTFLHTLEG